MGVSIMAPERLETKKGKKLVLMNNNRKPLPAALAAPSRGTGNTCGGKKGGRKGRSVFEQSRLAMVSCEGRQAAAVTN